MEELEGLQDPPLMTGDDTGSSSTLGLRFILLLAIHGPHALQPANKHCSVEARQPDGSSLVSNHLVFLPLPAVAVFSLVIETSIVLPPSSASASCPLGNQWVWSLWWLQLIPLGSSSSPP